MNQDTLFDLLAIVAGLVAWSYLWGMWRMTRARSRLVLLIAVSLMVVTRLLIVLAQEDHLSWIVQHRSAVGLPVYVLLAVGFGATYYELRTFTFGTPKEEP